MEKIVCPVCGTATSLIPIVIEDEKALFVDMSSDRQSNFGKARVFAITETDSFCQISYGIYQCQACNERFVAKKHKYDDKEWVAVYPIPHRPVPDEILQPIKSEIEEANLCFAVGAYRACASMCQRVLESLCQNKKVSGLNQLKDDGVISPGLFDRATEIRLWAGITKHKPLTESVLKEDAEQLLLYLDAILNAVYVEPIRFEAFREKRKRLEKEPT